MNDWEFPAGGINAAILLYGFLAMVAAESLPSWRRGVSIVQNTSLLIVLIGFSSVYFDCVLVLIGCKFFCKQSFR